MYRVTGVGNIRVRDIYGARNTRLLYCLDCKERFSERRGTVFFDSRLPEEKVVDILDHVVGGCSMRMTGRFLSVDADTVARYMRLLCECDDFAAYTPACQY